VILHRLNLFSLDIRFSDIFEERCESLAENLNMKRGLAAQPTEIQPQSPTTTSSPACVEFYIHGGTIVQLLEVFISNSYGPRFLNKLACTKSSECVIYELCSRNNRTCPTSRVTRTLCVTTRCETLGETRPRRRRHNRPNSPHKLIRFLYGLSDKLLDLASLLHDLEH